VLVVARCKVVGSGSGGGKCKVAGKYSMCEFYYYKFIIIKLNKVYIVFICIVATLEEHQGQFIYYKYNI
jgi:hypothetical protein